MRKHSILLLAFLGLLLASCRTGKTVQNQVAERSIVIIHDNDAHCYIDGYALLAGLRDAVSDTAWTSTVSSGDFTQGGTAGAISKGQYIIDIMKHVGYDAVTLGNHEFDFKVPRMLELLEELGAPATSVNLIDPLDGRQVFPYIMKTVGTKKIAYIGVTTPTTMETESYSFYDDKGKLIYDLVPDRVYSLVQESVNKARGEGADYVIILSHLGEDKNDMNVDSHGLIAATTGIDIVLDGHTHNIVDALDLPNKEGKPVRITQTGTQFQRIGKVVISPDGGITTENIHPEDIPWRNAEVQKATDDVKSQMKATTERIVCHSEVDLKILDEEGRQLVRMAETNAGDIVADAFRIMTGSQIAMTNGGGIRTELKKGDLSYGDVVALLPYDNYLCVVEVTGEKILEVLRENCKYLPITDGQFPQVSGIRFKAVVADHSIQDAEILNEESGKWEPLVKDRTYTLATTDYCISGGGFHNTLKDANIVLDAVLVYNDALVQYISKKLGSHISMEYAEPQGRITIVK